MVPWLQIGLPPLSAYVLNVLESTCVSIVGQSEWIDKEGSRSREVRLATKREKVD